MTTSTKPYEQPSIQAAILMALSQGPAMHSTLFLKVCLIRSAHHTAQQFDTAIQQLIDEHQIQDYREFGCRLFRLHSESFETEKEPT